MANSRTFTDQDIVEAVNQIQESGKKVTANALRRIIGSGRPSTLYATYEQLLENGMMSNLPQEIESDNATIESYELPNEIKEELDAGLHAISNMVARCNDLAHNVVEQRLNKAIDEAKDARIKAENAVAEAESNESAAWDEVETLTSKLEDEKESNMELNKRLVAIEAELNSTKEKNQELSNSIAQKEEENANLKTSESTLSTELNTTKGKLEVLSTELEGKKSELKEAAANISASKARESELSQALGRVEGELVSTKEKLEVALSDLEVQRVKINDFMEDISVSKERESDLSQAIARLEGELTSAKVQLQNESKQVTTLTKENKKLLTNKGVIESNLERASETIQTQKSELAHLSAKLNDVKKKGD